MLSELHSLSNELQDTLNREFESTASNKLTTYKNALISHTSCDNCYNTLPLSRILQGEEVLLVTKVIQFVRVEVPL